LIWIKKFDAGRGFHATSIYYALLVSDWRIAASCASALERQFPAYVPMCRLIRMVFSMD
jgi:hypothetical protein